MTKDEIKKWIKGHEGLNLKPYICKEGRVSIGYGRNIQDNGISIDEAELLFNNDLNKTEKELLQYGWYLNSPTNVKDALLNMCFNLGIQKLLTFTKMINAIIDKNYTQAAKEVMESKWAHQALKRAKDVAVMIRETYALES